MGIGCWLGPMADVNKLSRAAGGRSRLYVWMRKHHADLARVIAAMRAEGLRPSWPAMAAMFVDMGLMAPGARSELARNTWLRVRQDVTASQKRVTRAPEPVRVLTQPEPPRPEPAAKDTASDLMRRLDRMSPRMPRIVE